VNYLAQSNNQFGVISLGSGSKGNATLVKFANTLLLIDCGFSCKEIERRMQLKNIATSDVTAILVTHEHGDHISGVPALSNKYQLPVWMSSGTSYHNKACKIKNLNLFNTHQEFKIEGVTVCPVSVPHDAREACQYVFESQQRKVGILTDLGHVTPYIKQQYQGCDILMLEFNHERDLLLQSAYPQSLKARVSGDLGHLSNSQATEFLTDDITKQLKYLVAMHLSEENNRRELVLNSISAKKLNSSIEVILSNQEVGLDWLYT